eukprot:143869_1
MGNQHSTIDNDDIPTIKAGYLLKESKNFKTYRKRWMILKASLKFISCKTQYDSKSTEVFDLLKYAEISEIPPSTTKFQLISSDSRRTFEAQSELERIKWIEAIKNVIAENQNPDNDVRKMFWNKRLKWVGCSRYTKPDCVCSHVQRLSFVLSALVKHDYPNNTNAFCAKSFINRDFYSYSEKELIYDYYHVLQIHQKEIKEVFDIQKHTRSCNHDAECIAMQRLIGGHDESTCHDLKTDSDIFDIKETTALHFIDMIHCNLFHSQYIEKILCAESNDKFKTNVCFGSNIKNTTSSSIYYEIAPQFDYSNTVKRKYNDLKQEVLHNLSVSEWEFVVYKASVYQKTKYIKTKNENKNDIFSHVSELDLMICLILLCDYKNITIALRNSYLRKSINEKDYDLIKRHEKYYHFAKFSKICIDYFDFSENKFLSEEKRYTSLFHIIYDMPDIACGWLRVKWNYPISTVTNLESLDKEANGIVLELSGTDGVTFGCTLVSKFYFENEVLFMDCQQEKLSRSYIFKPIISLRDTLFFLHQQLNKLQLTNKSDQQKRIVTASLPIRILGVFPSQIDDSWLEFEVKDDLCVYCVRDRWGQWHEAVIVSHKKAEEPLPNQPQLSKMQEKNADTLSQLEAVYIHYKHWETKWDEWIF